MYPLKKSRSALVESETYPLGESGELLDADYAVAVVALSHTPVEQRLYAVMLSHQSSPPGNIALTPRRLTSLSGIQSQSTLRRGLEGLLSKLSIERSTLNGNNGKRSVSHVYKVFTPVEIIQRRRQNGHVSLNGPERISTARNGKFDRAVARVAENPMLTRREAQVALCCVEGLTNAEIGSRLDVSEQTVKFHLRHIFVKFGVRRRAELISKLLV
jgi:DNA-binding CsgD family transcriptional regulator